jgi:hypothetical protein
MTILRPCRFPTPCPLRDYVTSLQSPFLEGRLSVRDDSWATLDASRLTK